MTFGGLRRGVGGLLGRGAGAIGRAGLGALGSPALHGMWNGLAEIIGKIAPRVMSVSGGLKLFGWVLGHIGAKAIPVVGEILMLIDVLRFLGTHSRDIGKYIAMAAKWIVAHGLPMLIDAFKNLLMEIANFVKDSVMGIFSHKGGIWDVVGNFVAGAKAGWNYDAAPSTAGAPPANAGGGTQHFHGPINIAVPPGTPAQQAQALAKQLKQHVGSGRGTFAVQPSSTAKTPSMVGPAAAYAFH